MADKKQIIYILAASQAKSAGQILQSLDADSKGKDDIAGKALDIGGDIAMGFVNSDDKKVTKAVRAMRDACDAYLNQQSG
jgi:hypothetical protein